LSVVLEGNRDENYKVRVYLFSCVRIFLPLIQWAH
jgi:hypothetical protein